MSGDFRTVLAVLLAFLAGGFAAEVVVDDGGGKTRTVRVSVGKPKPIPEGVQIDAGTQVSAAEEKESAARPFSVTPGAPSLANAGPDIHEDQADETPPGVTPEESADAKVTPPGIGKPLPPAGAQNYTCTRNYVRNYSNRAPGTKVSQFVLHFTVSRPGSLPQIRNLFDTPSFGASSTLGLELDGECEQWVPFGKKAWTQGAFNSVSESVEIVTNDLSRAQWLGAPILKRGILAQIVADRLRARGLPPTLVDPVGCTPKAGYTDHGRLECGNSHWDVGRNFPWDVLGQQIRQRYNGASPSVKRSHKIVHAKLAKRCRGSKSAGCQILRKRNRDLHKNNPTL